jgi:hypothetical protein
MPTVKCPVCDGDGVVGRNNSTCPECHGKGYVYKPQWEIDKEREQSRDTKGDEKYILLREPKPELEYKAPPLRGSIVFVSAVVGVLAWLFRLFAYKIGDITFLHWVALKYLCSVPFGVILLMYLPNIIRWARKRGEEK